MQHIFGGEAGEVGKGAEAGIVEQPEEKTEISPSVK
jgi:hypothetical protein